MPELCAAKWPRTPATALIPFSFIRTMTVGSGITPDLLTSRPLGALAGLALLPLPPVGNYTPP
ncbi:hypothetical protein GGR20_000415 [Devosia subaequoris]|uniref:Uncharacterized protein n=1 Tax=Devosia subaequoris TaxID=395930 RepID=A0A7W6IK80_9HYPH|nr:hypothetical protein [Devosia subaequoris]